jgi:hypothetical protein
MICICGGGGGDGGGTGLPCGISSAAATLARRWSGECLNARRRRRPPSVSLVAKLAATMVDPAAASHPPSIRACGGIVVSDFGDKKGEGCVEFYRRRVVG